VATPAAACYNTRDMPPPTALTAGVAPADASVSPRFFHRALRGPVRTLLCRWFDLTVEGLEHLPARGPYIVAANHHNYLDGVVLGSALPVPIGFLVMPRVYRATPLHPLLHDYVGSIPIGLARPDPGAMRRALHALESGRVIGIFPEGPFSVCGRLEPGLPGVALLALRSGAPVVPAGIQGTYQALTGRRCYVPRRHPLRVRFGAPLRFSRDEGDDQETRTRVTARVMGDIAALIA
jgi:1-acyl-sn-glycerol-3-phosphate acyltransferase